MFALPFVFTIFIINFEAGLIVYWITTNVWTIGQQLLVRKLYPKPEPIEPQDAEDEPASPRAGSRRPSEGRRATARTAKAKRKAKPRRRRRRPRERRQRRAAKPPAPRPRKKKKRSGRRR